MRTWEARRHRPAEAVLTLDGVWAQRPNSSDPDRPRVERLRAVDLKLRREEITILCHTTNRLLGDVILGDHPRTRGRIYYRNENLECAGTGHRRPDGVIGLGSRTRLPPTTGTVAQGLQDLLVATGATPREAQRSIAAVQDRLAVAGLDDYLTAPHPALSPEQLRAVDVARVMLWQPELIVAFDPWSNAHVTTARRVWLDTLAAAAQTGTAVLIHTRHGRPDLGAPVTTRTFRIKLTGDLLPERSAAAS
ncbi:MAG: hypothetical protein IT198_02675 [Acidimicrobiia bacterium]|nr:hypothetical protein [Acidimicrobiia bacterium]